MAMSEYLRWRLSRELDQIEASAKRMAREREQHEEGLRHLAEAEPRAAAHAQEIRDLLGPDGYVKDEWSREGAAAAQRESLQTGAQA